MSRYASLPALDEDQSNPVGRLVADLLVKDVVDAVMVPAKQPFGAAVMQTVITSREEAMTADPFAPVVPTSSATLLAKLTRRESGKRLAAFLRPCEVRAFVELVKLKQASFQNLILIGTDCLGRYETTDYLALAEEAGADGIDIVDPCKACVTPVAEGVDLRLVAIGLEAEGAVGLEAVTEVGEKVMAALGLAEESPSGRGTAVAALVEERDAFRKTLRAEYKEKVKDVEGLMGLISSCINCYNCRVVCPVCYCRECVFVTDTFGHEGRQYHAWARKRGRLRMPSDTLFYHLTRMAHMSTLCVACGQCSSACPNDIPVSELFSMVGEEAQSVFDYVPGRDPEEAQPLAYFAENELPEVTGQVK